MPVAKKTSQKKKPTRRWSANVTEHSDALDLKNKIFTGSADKVATELKKSAEKSTRKKSTPYRSAMSMLTFYINRAGNNLPASRKKVLERAKDKLRELFNRPPKKQTNTTKSKQAKSRK